MGDDWSSAVASENDSFLKNMWQKLTAKVKTWLTPEQAPAGTMETSTLEDYTAFVQKRVNSSLFPAAGSSRQQPTAATAAAASLLASLSAAAFRVHDPDFLYSHFASMMRI